MNTPWYKKLSEYVDKCDKIDQHIIKILAEKTDLAPEIKSMVTYQKVATVYESNLIEESGLPKEATRKIIETICPSLPNTPAEYQSDNIVDLLQGGITSWTQDQINSFSELMQSEYDNPLETFSKLTPSVTFNNKNRKQMEVARHFIALEEIDRHATNKLIVFGMLRFIKNNPQNKEINRITGNPSLMDGLISSSKEFITEDFIKSIHKTLATDLLPTDAGVAAGEYRIDERGVGDYTVKFPSPEIIESCMKNWVRQTNQTMQDVWNKDLSPYVASAKISHEFVWIHPFPDFNGRMSRLIMNLVLLSTGKIFSVDLRGESKNKHRYITSLKKANRQDYSALAALIAMRRSEVLENIKVNLMTAGYDFGADS